MEIDPSEEENSRKSHALNPSAKGRLPISIAKLSGSSRVIPSERDFHFYNNFHEFRKPIEEIDNKSKNLLIKIGASENLFEKKIEFPNDKVVELDDEAASDWLENVNDETLERFDVSLDEFRRLRKKEEETGLRMMRVGGDGGEENGFQMVYGKKNKKLLARNVEEEVRGVQEVKVAAKVKPKVPFHIPTIPRPQDEYKIIVNNANQPFDHVWLERSEDGAKFIHPLEKLSVHDFVDRSDSVSEPVKPPPIETTPFKLIEEVKDLKQLAVILRYVNEFAVDLEHNQYRSFQGLTCLMQISTRTEDFVIDTLKLRIHVGPYLREVFKDPTKRKVMHGADRDIVWLQRDFGIYICNMFDTGQASRVLKMERHSLEYLLNHFCGVAANKEYQNADWRIRPLPEEMIRYAREDTHYLLYIYDLMKMRLLTSPPEFESAGPPLLEVYQRSYDVCTQLYEKELLTDTSYLHIYGLQDAELNAQQLAVVYGLSEWRDVVARAEDESTGYVLPNRTLIEIAKQMPLTTSKLRRVLKSKHPYIERNLGSVVSIIRHSIQNAAAFEEAAKKLKERRLDVFLQTNEENILATEESEVSPLEARDILDNAEEVSLHIDHMVDESQSSIQCKDKSQDFGSCSNGVTPPIIMEISHFSSGKEGNEKGKIDGHTANVESETLPIYTHKDTPADLNASHLAEATVQMLKKPSRAFGALLGSSAKRKFDTDKREQESSKLEQIKSTVSLPFHTFSGRNEEIRHDAKNSGKSPEPSHHGVDAAPPSGSGLEDIIVLDEDSDVEETAKGETHPASKEQLKQLENNDISGLDVDGEDEPMSLADLSSSFQECFPTQDRNTSAGVVNKSQPSEGFFEIQPFDYEAAREQVKFGASLRQEKKAESDNTRSGKRGSDLGQPQKDEDRICLPQGRRRQAFPASGNRSSTFR